MYLKNLQIGDKVCITSRPSSYRGYKHPVGIVKRIRVEVDEYYPPDIMHHKKGHFKPDITLTDVKDIRPLDLGDLAYDEKTCC